MVTKNQLLLLLMFSSLLYADTDTTIISNGGPGPYCISTRFIDSASIRVRLNDSTRTPPWNWIRDLNSILFLSSIDSGIPISVSFKTDYYGLPKVYSLFNKQFYSPSDTGQLSLKQKKRQFSLSDDDQLKISGYKSVGVSIGSFGQINIAQGLDIQIGGEIRPGTEISAHLSDEGSSLEGNTREISDFDMIYIKLRDPLFDVTAGDQYLSWLPGGILSGSKKIKGLSLNVHKELWHFGAFGALSGGKYAFEQFRAVTGIQGPYTLKGSGERGFIYPVSGTVKCRLNGVLLSEGTDNGFTVDYDMGTVTFTSQTIVTDDDIIKIEYEYKLFDYQRVVLGGSAGFHTPDSSFSAEGVLWSEFDNKNNPIDLSFSNEELRILKQTGDNPPQGGALNSEPVHPNDAAKEDAIRPLYKIIKSSGGASYFEHTRFNRLKPDSNSGFFNVWFSSAGDKKGEYERTYSSFYKDYIYYYTGIGKGSYTPRISLTTPKRLTSGELGIRLNYPILKADIAIAGQEHDKNLFSSKDDKNNLSSSGKINLIAGRKSFDKKSLWFTGNFSGTSRRFEGELVSAWDRYSGWNDRTLTSTPKQLLLWETGSGVTIIPGLWTQLLYGQNRQETSITDKLNNTTSYTISKLLQLTYNGNYFRHNPQNSSDYSHTQQLASKSTFTNHEITTSLAEQWREDSLHNGNGMITAALGYTFTPWALKQQITFDKLKSGKGEIFSSSDSGWQFLWNQSLQHTLFSIWKLDATSHFYQQVLNQTAKTTSLLINMKGELETESKRFSTQHSYRSSSERSTSYITVPIYAGKGLGTHIIDTTKIQGDTTIDYFIPHTVGDWIIERREVSDQLSDVRMKKNLLTLSWALEPPENTDGILGDLRWEGNLACEEYNSSEKDNISSWLPGVKSLQLSSKKQWSSAIQYSDLSYRQDIDWTHPSKSTFTASLNAEPFFKQMLSYRESGIESGLTFRTVSKKRKFTYNLRYTSLFHDDSTSIDYDMYDLGLEFLQRFELKHGFGVYLQENTGIGREKRHDEMTAKEPFNVSNHFYLQINPGITFRLNNVGWAELSYTFSRVAIPGEYDYRIARGHLSGLSHVLSFTADVRVGKYFSIRGMYRGEFRKNSPQRTFDNRNNIFSMEMKAFL